MATDPSPATVPARLVLEDGRVFHGRSCGAPGTTTGEVVFTTAMTGYQEVLTDPSFHGQIVTMTSPEIGVTGINLKDDESKEIQVAGFLVRRLTDRPSSWRSNESLQKALHDRGIVAMEGFDTRALTRHLRTRGDMRGVVSSDAEATIDDLLLLARGSAGVLGQNLTTSVTTREERGGETIDADLVGWNSWYDAARERIGSGEAGAPPHIVMVDFGVKWSIARHLAQRGCRVTIVPASTPAAAILARKPDGVLLSNGPGDPAACTNEIREIRELIRANVPVGGICLGFQLLGLACGAQTEKLTFGHRGSNHPVMVIDEQRTLVTSQNHGFSVRRDSLDRAGLRLTHLSLHDGTTEGFEHTSLPVMAVQFHPEAGPGPHDAHDSFFGRFLLKVATHRSATTQPAG